LSELLVGAAAGADEAEAATAAKRVRKRVSFVDYPLLRIDKHSARNMNRFFFLLLLLFLLLQQHVDFVMLLLFLLLLLLVLLWLFLLPSQLCKSHALCRKIVA